MAMDTEPINHALASPDTQQLLHELLAQSRVRIRGTSDWSPPFWTVLHMYAMLYPESPTEEQRQAAVKYMQEEFPNGLPCGF